MDTLLKNISYEYLDARLEGGEALSLQNISLALPKGSFTVIVGRSGCGKSTLLKILAGTLKPSFGEIQKPESFSMVFQSGALLPWRTVGENLEIAFDGMKKRMPSALHKRKLIEEELAKMKIGQVIDSFPRNLSGGQKQRVGIARSLVVRPELLLLDEPFSALDTETTRSLHIELLSLWKKSGMTILMVSHSIEEALELADKVVIMKEGKIREEIVVPFSRPRDESNLNFLGLAHRIKKMI